MVLASPIYTVVWDVQYGKIRIKYAIRVFVFSNFGSADF